MKCRRKKFSQFKSPTEYYWDRTAQRVVAVGWTGRSTPNRTVRRHTATAIERMRTESKAKDNHVDKLIDLEHRAKGQATRVGDKFRLD